MDDLCSLSATLQRVCTAEVAFAMDLYLCFSVSKESGRDLSRPNAFVLFSTLETCAKHEQTLSFRLETVFILRVNGARFKILLDVFCHREIPDAGHLLIPIRFAIISRS